MPPRTRNRGQVLCVSRHPKAVASHTQSKRFAITVAPSYSRSVWTAASLLPLSNATKRRQHGRRSQQRAPTLGFENGVRDLVSRRTSLSANGSGAATDEAPLQTFERGLFQQDQGVANIVRIGLWMSRQNLLDAGHQPNRPASSLLRPGCWMALSHIDGGSVPSHQGIAIPGIKPRSSQSLPPPHPSGDSVGHCGNKSAGCDPCPTGGAW